MLNNIYGGGQNTNYSTDEKVIGTQIDGKPIYRKVFSGSFTIGDMQHWGSNTLAADNNMEQVINATGYIYMQVTERNKYQALKIDVIESQINTVTGNLELCGPESRNVDYLLVEYTKTTD